MRPLSGRVSTTASGAIDMQRFNLTGKVGIVTGGNGGIGEGIARGLLECGATVVIAGRNAAKNETAVADLGKIGPPVSAFVMDVTVEAECKAVVAETVKRHGRLDILVNNAGGGANTGVRPVHRTRWRSTASARSSTPT